MSAQRVLVIAAHPDDEVLGAGGTIARHTQQGDTVQVIIAAQGITSRPHQTPDTQQDALLALRQAAITANQCLGVTTVGFLDYPDNQLDTVTRLDLIQAIEGVLSRFPADVVYTHHAGDVNIDHRCLHEAVVTACRPIPGNHVPQRLLFFEVASSTEWQTPGSAPAFLPNWFVSIDKTLAQKQQALRAYACEMRPWPHARSEEALMHLARWRGATIGVEAAEAFMLGRQIT